MILRYFFLVILLSAYPLKAQTQENYFWIGGSIGRSFSDVTVLRNWAISEGVNNVPSLTSNYLLGFDMGYERGRVPYQLTSAIVLPDVSGSVPYSFSFIFHSGYTWVQHPRVEIKTLGGIGFGYSIIRFRGSTPNSFQALPYDHSEAFARSGLFLCQFTAQLTYNPEWNSSKRFRPMFVGNLGYLGKLAQSTYRYGENVQDIDGNYMVGEKVDMPKFFKGNTFLSLGIWVRFST